MSLATFFVICDTCHAQNGLFHCLIIHPYRCVQGGYREYDPGGWSFKGLSQGVRRHNRCLSRGEWNNIEACPGGWNKIEACPGGIYKSVPGGRDIIVPRGVIVICRAVRLNNGIAQYASSVDGVH